jgi:hypothetical protein
MRTAAASLAKHRKVALEDPMALVRVAHGTPTLAELIRWYIDTFETITNWQRSKQSHLELLERHTIERKSVDSSGGITIRKTALGWCAMRSIRPPGKLTNVASSTRPRPGRSSSDSPYERVHLSLRPKERRRCIHAGRANPRSWRGELRGTSPSLERTSGRRRAARERAVQCDRAHVGTRHARDRLNQISAGRLRALPLCS